MKLRFFIVFLIVTCITAPLEGCTRSKVETTLETISIDMALVKEDLTLKDLKKMNGGQVKIIYCTDADIPRDISGTFSTRKVFTAEDAVYALLSVRSFMQIGDASFTCTEIDDSGKNRSFQLQQVYKGIAVDNGHFLIVASKVEGNTIGVTGLYQHLPDLDVNPKISMKKARKAFKLKWGTKITRSQLVVLGDGVSELGDRLAWKFIVSAG